MIHITQHKRDLKMSGFISINTSQHINPFCQKCEKNRGTVCRYCYGRLMEINYTRLKKHIINNYYLFEMPLSGPELKEACNLIKLENRHYIRFHSIGELSGINNLMNFYKICELLPGFQFGLWSKRSNLITRYTEKKPDNLSLIYSNMFLDHPVEKIPAKFNGVFNVVSYQYAIDNDIKINCTGRCIECLKCYTGEKVIINELLKRDQTNIKKGFLKPLEEVQ